jgi:hypothetical protein
MNDPSVDPSGTIVVVDGVWYLLPDGTYRRISAAEDIASDAAYTFADARATVAAWLEVRVQSQRLLRESRALVAQSRRDRRLRNTRLRIVGKGQSPST